MQHMWQLPSYVQVPGASQKALAETQMAEKLVQAPAPGAFLPSAVDLQALRAGAPKAYVISDNIDLSCHVLHALYPCMTTFGICCCLRALSMANFPAALCPGSDSETAVQACARPIPGGTPLQ